VIFVLLLIVIASVLAAQREEIGWREAASYIALGILFIGAPFLWLNTVFAAVCFCLLAATGIVVVFRCGMLGVRV
jgi:hypothetical protein